MNDPVKAVPVPSTTVGTCIVCTREIAVRQLTEQSRRKLGRVRDTAIETSHVLVHHGYHRPGYGYIIGDCYAVNLPPHELSPVAANLYRSFCEKMKADAEDYLNRLETGKVDVLHRHETLPVPTTQARPEPRWRDERSKYDPGWRDFPVPYYSTELAGTERHEVWLSLHTAAVKDQQRRIGWCEDEIARMGKALKGWKVAPLREREEPVPDPNRRRRRRFFRGGRG